MLDYYSTATKTMRHNLFLHHKQPREEWDPTLFEHPLCSLHKCPKAHWDSNEWGIQTN